MVPDLILATALLKSRIQHVKIARGSQHSIVIKHDLTTFISMIPARIAIDISIIIIYPYCHYYRFAIIDIHALPASKQPT